MYAVQSVRHGLRITQAAHTGGVLANVRRTLIQAAHATQAAHRVPPCGGLCACGLCAVRALQLVRLAAAYTCRRWRFLASSTHAVYIRFAAYTCGVRTV